jgi:hypothetical protein
MGLHTVPEMDHGFYDDDGDPHEGYVTEERAQEMFIAGAQQMREMLARFVEQGGDAVVAGSIRANWVSSWGKDPGLVPAGEAIVSDPWAG